MTAKNDIKKVSNNESDTQFLDELIMEKEIDFQKQKEMITLVKKNITDKQIFDIQEFEKLYNLQEGFVKVKIDQKMIDDLEIEYYLKYSYIKSLKSFSDIKTQLDREELN